MKTLLTRLITVLERLCEILHGNWGIKRLLTEAEAAEYLGIDRGVLRRLRHKGEIHAVGLTAKNVRYDKKDCDVLIENKKFTGVVKTFTRTKNK